jgi:hypothetical protein
MSVLQMGARTAWDYFYTGSPSVIQSNVYTTRTKPTSTYTHILGCVFRSITSTDNGGALYCTVSWLLVESTSFFLCSTSASGGAIYFSGSQCVLHEVCGNDCCTTGGTSYQFAYTNVQSSVSNKNYLNYSTVAHCLNENTNAYYTIYHGWGRNLCLSLNMSMNKCYSRSGIHSVPTDVSKSITGSLLYSSFTDNNATHNICIGFWRANANCEIKSCNILRNTQVSFGSSGTITPCGNLDIGYSCILENNARYVFYQPNTYTITISKCTVNTFSNNGYLTIQNTVKRSFIHALNHISTHNCDAEYDVFEYLNIQYCYTCARLSNVITFTGILIFNFIYTESGDLWY